MPMIVSSKPNIKSERTSLPVTKCGIEVSNPESDVKYTYC
jgi:hypothetical protein